MVRENVDIVFREQGIAVIKRKIDDLGEASARATRGVFLLQRALFTLGGFGIVRALQQQADAMTNLENRLKLTTSSSRELQSVQSELFNISRRARADLEGVAQTYTRTALSAKALGRSQEEVLKFTETVTKAAVLSGASTREINASLIQLGQGIASNRLGGDELRSILEQLPLVADIIAKELGVTRGQLRELGSEGKITGDVILTAFANAAEEIDNLFLTTQPTIEQAFTIAKTNFLEFLDTFDDATGASGKLANAIIVISQSMDILVGTAAAFVALLGVSVFGRIVKSFTAMAVSLRAANVQQTAVLKRLIDIRTATVTNTQAQVANNVARQAQLTQNLALITQKKLLLQQEVLEAQYVVKNGQARILQTGQFVNLTAAKANYARLTQNLSILENLEASTAAKLAAARAAQTGATNALAAAQARLTAAQAAATAGARALATANAALAASLGFLRSAGAGFLAFLGGWPGVLLLAGAAILGLVSTAESATERFNRLSTNTSSASAGITELTEVQNRLNEAILAAGANSDAANARIIANTQAELQAKTSLLNLERESLVRLQQDRQVAIDETLAQIEAQQARIEEFRSQLERFNENSNTFKNITGFIAEAEAEIKTLTDQVTRLKAEFTLTGGQIEQMAAAISSAYSDIFAKTGGIIDKTTTWAAKVLESYNNGSLFASLNLGAAVDPAITAADTLIGKLVAGINLIRQAIGLASIGGAEAPANPGQINSSPRPERAPNDIDFGLPAVSGGGGGGGGGSQVSFEDELADIQKKIDLEKQYGIQKEINNNILSAEDKLKRSLSETEKEQISNATKLLEIAKAEGEILNEILGPQDALATGQQALNNLLDQGTISLEQYNTKLRELQVAANAASGTLGGAFKAAIGESIISVSDFGKQLGDVVVNAAGDAASALVDFAITGKGSIKDLFAELFANLARLIANDLFTRLLGGLFGAPGGGLNQGGPLALLGFAGGGSILPTGPGSTDSQVVAFKKRPDERVDILTPAQQEARKKSSGGSNSNSPIVSPNNVKIVNVLDPSIIGDFLSTNDGENLVMNVLKKNGVI